MASWQLNNCNSQAHCAVDTHGPRISAVQWSVVTLDGNLYHELSVGDIQMAEWTFSVTSYNDLVTTPGVNASQVLGYTFDGIGFNTVHAYVNNYHFREAIAWLTDYGNITTYALAGGEAGAASIQILPTANFPFMSGHEPTSPAYLYGNFTQAAVQFWYAGLRPFNSGTALTFGQLSTVNSGTVWCAKGASWPCTQPTINFYYRNDDPLRMDAALTLCDDAIDDVGFHLSCTGITGSDAGAEIYGASAGAVTSAGVYCPLPGPCGSTPGGGTTPPVVNAAVANSSADLWDMYTFGWIASPNFEFQAEIWNSVFMGTSLNFPNYYNSSMDLYSNQVIYATTIPAAEAAIYHVVDLYQQQLPYINLFFQNTLFADYVTGWSGMDNATAYGPNTGAGLYYSLFNVHISTLSHSEDGGTIAFATHEVPDTSGLNPLYNTNWEWQVDLWSEFYDSPLATPPWGLAASPYSFINWMTSATPVTNTFNGPLPAGSFCYQYTSTSCPGGIHTISITGGESITLTFIKNMTFSDNVPVTPKDLEYSLYYWDVAAGPKQSDELTPLTATLTSSAGLIAANINVAANSITLYLGSNSIWNLPAVDVVIFPYHVLQYFNVDHVATAVATADFTQPYLSQSVFSIQGLAQAPTWMDTEPNMEIGEGPFVLSAYSATTGSGLMTANTNYYRAAWWSNINSTNHNIVAANHLFNYTYTIAENIFNPNAVASICPYGLGAYATNIGPYSTGYCGITGHSDGLDVSEGPLLTTNVVTLVKCTSIAYNGGQGCSPVDLTTVGVAKYSITQVKYAGTCTQPSGGVEVSGECYTDQYKLVINTAGVPASHYPALTAGYYEVVLSATFSFNSEARTWYQAIGFQVS